MTQLLEVYLHSVIGYMLFITQLRPINYYEHVPGTLDPYLCVSANIGQQNTLPDEASVL